VTAAAEKAGVDRSTPKRARQRLAKFAERWEDAWEQGTDALEAEPSVAPKMELTR
jgi:hypothetical protein